MKTKSAFLLFFFLVSWNTGSTYAQETTEKFEDFLGRFTASASFQYSRIKFPLATPITLIAEDGDEKTFPFTKDKWPLLDDETFVVGREEHEDGEFYISHYVVDDPTIKEFEVGLEESELDLRLVFELIEGKWYLTDCYTAWYSFDLPVEEMKDTIDQIHEQNKSFIKRRP